MAMLLCSNLFIECPWEMKTLSITPLQPGNSVFCKGVVEGGVSVTYSGPILNNNKYAVATVSFSVHEVDPYDADTVMVEGGFRGIRKTLESNMFKTN